MDNYLSNVNKPNTSVWDNVVSLFGDDDIECESSRATENLKAIWPVLNSVIISHIPCIRSCDATPRVLDFGCGTGVLAEKLCHLGFIVYACDSLTEMIKQAHLMSSGKTIYETGGLDYVYRQKPFLLITAIMVFQFIDDIRVLISGLISKLDKDGLLFFAIHHVDYISECSRYGIKFRGFQDGFFPTTGEIQIGTHWITTYVRSPEWYNEVFVELGMIRIGNLFNEIMPPSEVSRNTQIQWMSSKYYIAWYKKRMPSK